MQLHCKERSKRITSISVFSYTSKQYDNFFQVRKNVVFKRARFNCRCQAVGESVEQFITSLYTLAENCDYGDLKDQILCDRIVVGICNQTQSERLQMDAGLTKTLVRQRKSVHEQQILLKHGQGEDRSIDFLRQGILFRGKAPPGNRSQAPARKPQQTQSKCSQCGRGPHTRQQMLSATTAKGRGTTVHNVFTRRLQKSPYPQSQM